VVLGKERDCSGPTGRVWKVVVLEEPSGVAIVLFQSTIFFVWLRVFDVNQIVWAERTRDVQVVV
jgi:hypothetical protein